MASVIRSLRFSVPIKRGSLTRAATRRERHPRARYYLMQCAAPRRLANGCKSPSGDVVGSYRDCLSLAGLPRPVKWGSARPAARAPASGQVVGDRLRRARLPAAPPARRS